MKNNKVIVVTDPIYNPDNIKDLISGVNKTSLFQYKYDELFSKEFLVPFLQYQIKKGIEVVFLVSQQDSNVPVGPECTYFGWVDKYFENKNKFKSYDSLTKWLIKKEIRELYFTGFHSGECVERDAKFMDNLGTFHADLVFHCSVILNMSSKNVYDLHDSLGQVKYSIASIEDEEFSNTNFKETLIGGPELLDEES
jgi:hypothetical protein|tara:strand:- start:3171 stop:3758 length:588 start_codon:yes stop_codon:yes gene_type:complete